MLEDEMELEKVLKIFYGRKNKDPRPVDNFTGESPRRIYKAVPEKIWLNDDMKVDGHHVDTRIEVNLK